MVVRALLIGNAGDTDPGFVGHALRREGWSFTERIRESHESWPSTSGTHDLEGAALIVSLGSGWSTYWDDVAPAVRAEQDLMRTAIAAGTPVFGICFGAQQLATVLGGTVARAPVAEIGWCTVRALPESASAAPAVLFEDRWMQWHYDSFTVPSGATVLAESPAGPQVFVHRGCVGVQFHPEATESIVAHWSSDEGADELTVQGIDPVELVAETREHIASARRRCDDLVRWVISVAGIPTRRTNT